MWRLPAPSMIFHKHGKHANISQLVRKDLHSMHIAFSVDHFWISTTTYSAHIWDLRVHRASQEFLLLKTINDAWNTIYCVSWGEQLLAAAGDESTVRIYDPTKELRPRGEP